MKNLTFLQLRCAGNEGRGMMRGDKGEEFRVMFLSRFCSASVVIRFVYIHIISIIYYLLLSYLFQRSSGVVVSNKIFCA